MCYTFWFKIHWFDRMDSAWQLKYMTKTYIFMFMHVCISVVIAAAAAAVVVVVVTVVYIWSVPFCAFTYFLRSQCLLQKRFKFKKNQTNKRNPSSPSAFIFVFNAIIMFAHTKRNKAKITRQKMSNYAHTYVMATAVISMFIAPWIHVRCTLYRLNDTL